MLTAEAWAATVCVHHAWIAKPGQSPLSKSPVRQLLKGATVDSVLVDSEAAGAAQDGGALGMLSRSLTSSTTVSLRLRPAVNETASRHTGACMSRASLFGPSTIGSSSG